MGWGKLIGGLAKDLATGYVAERGIKGTLEDIGGLAKNVTSFFKSDSDNADYRDDAPEVDWKALSDEIDALIEKKEYGGAAELLDNVYEQIGEELDGYFYVTLCEIQVALLMDAAIDDDYDFDKILEDVRASIKNIRDCGEGDTWDDSVEALEERLASAIELRDWWKNHAEFWEEFIKLRDKNEFDKAQQLLEDYYDKHGDGKKDMEYYFWTSSVLYRRCLHMIANGERPSEEVLARQKTLMEKVATFENSEEDVERMKAALNEVKVAMMEMTPTKAVGATGLTEDEQSYIDEVRACLADNGAITDRERRLLSRLCKSLGISEQRAAELEAMCKPSSLTADEQSYLEEVKACLAEDGAITDRERRLLSRLSKSLGISADRAMEIEKMTK